MTDVLMAIYRFDGGSAAEAGDVEVVAATDSQVVASMAIQAGWQVYSNLPILRTTNEFLNWAEENKP